MTDFSDLSHDEQGRRIDQMLQQRCEQHGHAWKADGLCSCEPGMKHCDAKIGAVRKCRRCNRTEYQYFDETVTGDQIIEWQHEKETGQ